MKVGFIYTCVCVYIYMCIYIYIFFFFWPHHKAYRILVPQPGVKPGLRQWRHRVLTTGPPGNSSLYTLNNFPKLSYLHSCIFMGWYLAQRTLKLKTSGIWIDLKIVRIPLGTIQSINYSTALSPSWLIKYHLII